jgi:protein-disulfide isomerase
VTEGVTRAHEGADTASVRPSRLAVSVSERDHALGPPRAAVTLVEYGDFECPYCAAATKAIAYLRRHLGDRMRFVFRHFPVTELHPHAEGAALAAEAASAQGSFWQMHDLLFERQAALEGQDLERYVQEIGLDPVAFRLALDTRAGLDRVRGDLQSGRASGVNTTPKFFINELRYDGTDLRELVPAVERVAKEPNG